MAEEENFSLEDSGLVMERGNRRARKEEPKLSDVRDLCDLLWCFFSIRNGSCLHLIFILSVTE